MRCGVCEGKKRYGIHETSNLDSPGGFPISEHRYENMKQLRNHKRLSGHKASKSFKADEELSVISDRSSNCKIQDSVNLRVYQMLVV